MIFPHFILALGAKWRNAFALNETDAHVSDETALVRGLVQFGTDDSIAPFTYQDNSRRTLCWPHRASSHVTILLASLRSAS